MPSKNHFSLQHSAFSILALLAPAAIARAQQAAPPAPIQLAIDATEIPRGIIHGHLSIPVQPGPFTLVYPKWIPGEHGPTGPVVNLVGLKLSAGGKAVSWRRDDVDMFAVHCDIPAGVTTLEVAYDFVTPASADDLGMITWNQILVYPLGKPSDAIPFSATLKLPAHWKFGTALPVASQTADAITFKTVSLTTLIDSPVITGLHFRSIPVAPPGAPLGPLAQTPPHFLDMVADADADLDMKPETIALYGNLVAQAGALFGTRHYNDYHWLVTFRASGGGLEHHESSDDRVEGSTLSSEAGKRRLAGLLAHEYIHSWNGKFRRPEGLATPDYQEPMKDELLWVYEGLTEYLATVLCPRAGLLTADDYREKLAETAASMDYTAGRQWRPLIDTTIDAPILYSSPAPWRDYRRSTDFYPEGILLWLDIDVTIRQQTQNKKSIDDFCRIFHGGPNNGPDLKPYTVDEVINTLNQVAPYDWKSFLNHRLNEIVEHPLAGITNGGWKLIYTETPSDDQKYREGQLKFTNLMYSIGLQIGNEDGQVRDIVPGMAGDKAGLAPGMKIVAVNSRRFTAELLKTAVKDSKTNPAPIELLVESNDFFKTCRFDYHDGARYPHLERDESKPDLISEIAKPLPVK